MKTMGTVALGAITSLALSASALAENLAGKPIPGGHHFQRSVTPVMDDITWLDDFLHVIIGVIVLFVVGLLAYIALKFTRAKNPEPATFTHNTTIEVIWTAVPVLILIVIAIPSVKLLFLQLDVPEADLTIKATGNQWFWTYEYPDQEVEFDAVMLDREELEDYGYADDEYLLATDERVIVPVDAIVHVLVTASDVIHAWTIPSFGSKIDAMPGRINETWFQATEVGTYFGQCSELCGKDHTYMPIVVEVVSQEDYETWVLEMASRDDEPKTRLAAAAE
ncbi:MAG: cytochrome c oxidase subunit II [Pseudomonadota bacterium]